MDGIAFNHSRVGITLHESVGGGISSKIRSVIHVRVGVYDIRACVVNHAD